MLNSGTLSFQPQIKSEKKRSQARVQQLESEIQRLCEQLKNMEEIQDLTDQQLQEADEEKERIFAQLEDLESKVELLWFIRNAVEVRQSVSKYKTVHLCSLRMHS